MARPSQTILGADYSAGAGRPSEAPVQTEEGRW